MHYARAPLLCPDFNNPRPAVKNHPEYYTALFQILQLIKNIQNVVNSITYVQY